MSNEDMRHLSGEMKPREASLGVLYAAVIVPAEAVARVRCRIDPA